jgi:hypothetical protein
MQPPAAAHDLLNFLGGPSAAPFSPVSAPAWAAPAPSPLPPLPRFTKKAPEVDPERERAAMILQRLWRTRKFRMMWPSLEKLREAFMDQRALAAGAAGNAFYSNTALAIREALRHAPEVSEATQVAWEACTEAAGTPSGLDFETYSTMCRKLYLAAKLEEADAAVSTDECLSNMLEDWKDDCEGGDVLTRELFARCWFQLVRRAAVSTARAPRRPARLVARAPLTSLIEPSSAPPPPPRLSWARAWHTDRRM